MSGDPWFLSGLKVIEDQHVPRGQVFSITDPIISSEPVIVAHPSTMMEVMNGGRTPLWTRHMLGVKEAERDQRKQNRH